MKYRLFILGSLLAWVPALLHAQFYDPTEYHKEVLHRHGIPTNVTGLRSFLTEVLPENSEQRKASDLLRQLGSSEYQERTLAGAALGRLVPFPLDDIQRATENPDADIRRRAKGILLNRRDEFDYLIYAALEYIAARPIPGLIPELSRLLPACPNHNQQVALRFAIVKSATPADREQLLALLKHESPVYRLIGAHAIATVLPAEASRPLQTLLDDPDVLVRVEAASRLGQAGYKTGLFKLVDCLMDESVNARGQAAWTLRLFSGRAFGYSCYAPEDQRSATAAQWQSWVEEQVEPFQAADQLEHHYLHTRNLVALFNRNEVEERDLEGNLVSHMTGYRNPWAVHLLPNGHKLISWRDDGRHLTEYDLAGREIWHSIAIESQPRSIQILNNGRLWVTANGPAKTIEMDYDGDYLRKRPFDKVLGQLRDGHRLDDGSVVLLFDFKGRIREIDHNGVIVREIDRLNEPQSIQALPARHLLVAETGAQRIVEFDGDSNKVWELAVAPAPIRAQRLPNGHTLISTEQDVREVDTAGTVRWKQALSGHARAWRF